MPVRPGVTDWFNVFLGKCYMKMLLVFFLVFLDTFGDPVFTSRIPISAQLILIFRYLGGHLYPFASEASPMLYENAWYFWRLEPPFLLPESLFLRN